MTESIKKYDADYNIKTCVKCGRALGIAFRYNAATDRIIVECKECGHTYIMRPKDWKE